MRIFMPTRAAVSEFKFILDNIIDYEEIIQTSRFKDANTELVSQILIEAGRMCDDVLSPLNRVGDLQPAILSNGVVKTSPGFGDGYHAVAQGGWISTSASPEFGGMGLPQTLTACVNEMMAAACLSLQLNPLMTQGQIEAIENHADEEIKSIYLPKLISGEWCGTMNLTEPHAGSDVGALSTKAEPNGDGTYAITGQKIYISWADNDFTENVIHLVLARLPEAVPGPKGISLFLVPKKLPDAKGNAGVSNNLKVVSLEHKMGLHGSPTAVMQYEGATGWIIGEPNDGLRAMFTMMNNARLGVGGQGIGVAEAAFQHSTEYALNRKQGKSTIQNKHGTIIDHADVRRMLISMRADIFASRSIELENAKAIDMANATGEPEWINKAAFLTPITKVFGTEIGINISNLGVQIHGGMGFIEETGAAQFSRDVRVTAIYEGTNGIQAMDLVGRKMMDNGETAYAIINQIKEYIDNLSGVKKDLSVLLGLANETLRETVEYLISKKEVSERFGGAMPFLMGFARVLGGFYHLKAAVVEGDNGPRTKLAEFYIRRILPEAISFLVAAKSDPNEIYNFSVDELVGS